MPRFFLTLLICAVTGCTSSTNTLICGGGYSPPQPQIGLTIIENSTVDQMPVPATPVETALVYPLEMSRAGLSGLVTARLTISNTGNVTNVSIIRSSIKEFEPRVLTGALRIKFYPGKNQGRAVACIVDAEFKFYFDDD